MDAGTASTHGLATLVRFVTASRDPTVEGDRECGPPFPDLLANEPSALADVDIQAVSADMYRLV